MRAWLTAAMLCMVSGMVYAQASTSKIEIREPWARLPLEGVADTTAYFEIRNLAADPDKLLSASSPWAARVVIEYTVMDGYDMKPKMADAVKVGARSAVKLRPGDYHLKLEGLTQVVKPDSKIPITLKFEKAGRVELDAEVSNQKLGNLDRP